MRKLQLFQKPKDDYQELAEVADMERLLEGESIFEAQEEQDDYTNMSIICFTFEDGMIPKRDGSIGTQEMIETSLGGNDRFMCNKNINGVNVFIATERDDLHKLGYVIMNTREFIRENPDGLFDDWVGLLNEIK